MKSKYPTLRPGEGQKPKQNVTGMNRVLGMTESWDKVQICLQGVAQLSKVGPEGTIQVAHYNV